MQSFAFTIADPEDAARFEAEISRDPRVYTRDESGSVRKAYEVSSITTTKSLALVTADGDAPFSPGRHYSALFGEMLDGWRRQQQARRLTGPFTEGRIRLVRRFRQFTGAWPWQWTPAQAGEWIAGGGWAHSTVRSYEGALAGFLDYACDPRHGWASECEQRAGARPVQVCHEGNAAVHAARYEGRPERQPLTRVELQAFPAPPTITWFGRRRRGGRDGWPRSATRRCSR